MAACDLSKVDTPEQMNEHPAAMTRALNTPQSPAAQTLEILRTHSLATIVLQELERMILSGEIKPGERINEKALAASQSVSRGPVREACRRLEQAGLVEIVVNRGVFVRRLKAKDAAELSDIRASLSGLAGRLLAENVSDEQFDHLADMVARMEALAERGDVEGYYPLNMEFHAAMLRYTGNDRLAEMCAAIDKELYLFRRISLDKGWGLRNSVKEHRKILEALHKRDPARLAKVMEQHAITGKRRLLGSLGETEEGEAPQRAAKA